MALFIAKYLCSVVLLLAADESVAFTTEIGGAVPATSYKCSPRSLSVSSPSPSSLIRQRSPSTIAAITTTSLHLSKDNDRARMEKTWENMMGEDWREFRARLVAREHVDAAATKSSSDSSNKSKSSSQEDGGIFGAITSMFSRKIGNKENDDSSTSTATTTATNTNIFDGDAVGGATKFSTISSFSSPCSDPFMDEEECHIIYDEPKVKIDKHRWAHPLFHVEPGCILVANEKLGGVFHQTVVLIIDHHDTAGSTGMVINRPFPGNLMKVASDGESNIDLSLKMAFSNAPVAYGGPVMQDQFSTLHGFGEVMGSKKVCPGVFVGGSSQLMHEVRRNNLHPTEVLFVKGHAAWVPGQLVREIEKGVWYVAAASSDLILRYAGAPVSKEDNASDLWADVLSCMGDKFVNIATAHSGRGDERMLP